MALEKKITEYQIMGGLFSDMENALMALTLWKRILTCIERILRVLGETLGITPPIPYGYDQRQRVEQNPCNG